VLVIAEPDKRNRPKAVVIIECICGVEALPLRLPFYHIAPLLSMVYIGSTEPYYMHGAPKVSP